MELIVAMLILMVSIWLAVAILVISTMIAIIGIRKELHIKNMYDKRTLIDYPYNVPLSELERDVYEFLYSKSPQWIYEKKISKIMGVNYDKAFFDVLDSLEEKELVREINGLYSVRLKNE